jgi:hypothetical protein
MEPQFIIIDDIYYYNAEELKEFDISFFEKTNKTIRKIIKIKNIPEEEYNYFCFNKKDNKWKISNKNKPSPKAKLFITEKWSKQNIPKFNNELTNNYEEAPDILELNDNEKFKDVDNNPLNIEVRGERNVNKCFFKLKDIIINFNMNRLKDTIEDKNTNYEEKLHYKYFIINNTHKNGKKTSKKVLYLTYLGLIRVLFVSKNPNCENFQKWSINILFTHQLGTNEDKKKLSNKLMGIPVKEACDVFKTSSNSISCVYLLSLNSVKELRDTFNISKNIPDDAIVCKYGKTDDLKRRIKEHQNNYKKLKNVELSIMCYSYVDKKLITEAENQIKNYFTLNNMKFDYENSNELVIINKEYVKNAKNTYQFVFSKCSGSMGEIINKMNEMEHEFKIDKMEQENKMNKMKKDFEIKEIKYEHTIDKLKTKLENTIDKLQNTIDKLKTKLEHQNKIMKIRERKL